MSKPSSSGRGPDFIIAGVMKSGTTALYDFICEHPGVLPAADKELHYFTLNQHRGRDWYFSKFPNRPGYLTGEASPSYFQLSSNALFRWMKTDCPSAKILVIVRDPTERAISHFTHLKSLNRAPALQDMSIDEFFAQDIAGAVRRTTAKEKLLSIVLRSGCYAASYGELKSSYEPEEILIIPSADLAERPAEIMRAVFRFLDLPPFESKVFEESRYSLSDLKEQPSDETIARLRGFYEKDAMAFIKVVQRDGGFDRLRDVP